MKRAILYTRISTNELTSNGYSLQVQKEHLLNFCKMRQIEVVEIFTETFSACKGFDRPAYGELMEHILTNTGIDYVLFTQWSRFSRNVEEAYQEIKRLKLLGIEAQAVDQWLDMSGPESLVMLTIYMGIPQVEDNYLANMKSCLA